MPNAPGGQMFDCMIILFDPKIIFPLLFLVLSATAYKNNWKI